MKNRPSDGRKEGIERGRGQEARGNHLGGASDLIPSPSRAPPSLLSGLCVTLSILVSPTVQHGLAPFARFSWFASIHRNCDPYPRPRACTAPFQACSAHPRTAAIRRSSAGPPSSSSPSLRCRCPSNEQQTGGWHGTSTHSKVSPAGPSCRTLASHDSHWRVERTPTLRTVFQDVSAG